MASPTYTLGISAYAHDSSAALLRDGVIVAMAEEERFNRKKHTTDFPEQAIRFCLSRAGITLAEVNDFAFFWNPTLEITGNLRHFLSFFPATLNLFRAPSGGEMKFTARIKKMRQIGEELRERFQLSQTPEVEFVEHHMCHAASAFYPSGFESAAILTIDGRGEATSTMLSKGRGLKLEKLLEVKVPHSIGHYYAAITDYLGFTSFFEEWKVMGLSAYGTDRFVKEFEDLIHIDSDGLYRLNLEYFHFHTHGQNSWVSPKFLQKFGPARERLRKFDQDDFDLAYALQKTIERAGVALAKHLRKISGESRLCLSGGVVLNCLMNREIVRHSGFEEFFFQPVANDAGTSLGAALYLHHHLRGASDRSPLSHLYFGPEFSDEEIEGVLRKRGLPFDKCENIAATAAQRIAEGKIVGWFQGRMESGPRALGNRSIVVDPTRIKMKDKLNAKVKRREGFRPFAPSVLQHKCGEFFELPKGISSPYMMLIGDVKMNARSRIPAVTHADGTARIQTVSKEQNPRYFQLLEEFEKIKGVPVLLNTSFNENEPIVCTPEQAVDCYLRTDFDVLAIGDFLVEKRNS